VTRDGVQYSLRIASTSALLGPVYFAGVWVNGGRWGAALVDGRTDDELGAVVMAEWYPNRRSSRAVRLLDHYPPRAVRRPHMSEP
jgi:hypothetical protein